MQAGGVAVRDVYQVSGKVLINGVDVGAHVDSISVDRDIPSGLPGGGGFRSASGTVTATWGGDVSSRVIHPWSGHAQDPSQVTYEWAGTPHASPSMKLVDGVEVARNLMPSPRAIDSSYYQSNVEVTHDQQELQNLVITTGGGTSYVGFTGITVEPGQWFASALSYEWGDGVGRVRHQLQFRGPNNESIAAPQIQRDRADHPNGGRSIFWYQVPAGAVEARWYSWFYMEGSFTQAPDGSNIRVGKYSAALSDTEHDARAQVAEFFDGDTASFRGSPRRWPPKPMDQVEIILSDGSGREWTQLKGTVKDPSGTATSRTVTFTVQDNYQPLNDLVNVPALSSSMPHLDDANDYRAIQLHSIFITDFVLRQVGRYATPPRANGDVVGATFNGSTWPERGTLLESKKYVPDGGPVSFPNMVTTSYGMAAQNVTAEFEPNIWSGTPGDGRLHNRPVELTQEVLESSEATTMVRARFWGGGRVALIHYVNAIRVSYYPPNNGDAVMLLQVSKADVVRVAARFWMVGSTLFTELRTLKADGTIVDGGSASTSVGTGLNGQIEHVQAHGEGTQGAFQVAFPREGREWDVLGFEPNAVLHPAPSFRNHFTGFPPQVNVPAIKLLNDQADAEFAQWWIDEHDVLQWWDRGLLAQQSVSGRLTGLDHIKDMPWSYNFDAARSKVTVKYKTPITTSRWRTNLTLWQGSNNTLQMGDTDETFVNVPNDEIWLGVHWQDPYRYAPGQSTYWPRRGIGTVVGGIAIDGDGNERQTASINVQLRKINDEAYVFETSVSALGSDEQAALQFPDEYETDTSLWARWRGENLPLLRGKKKVELIDEIVTSDIRGPSQAPAFEHNVGFWIQSDAYAGTTADYAAASLTDPIPRIERADIMPVFNLQVGDVVSLVDPETTGLAIIGLVVGNSIDADLSQGTASQQISLTPISIRSTDARWVDFGEARRGDTWQIFGADRSGDTWADFGNSPLD